MTRGDRALLALVAILFALGPLAAGDAGGLRPHTPAARSGTPCKSDFECDLNQICRRWRAPDDGVRCVAGCRTDRDCREGSFCGRPPGCMEDACKLCLKVDWSGP